jgi:hypothetical protein
MNAEASLAIHTRIYRTFLLAYPRAFRQVYGGDMAQVFSDRLREEREKSGGRATVGVWVFTLLDLFRSAPVQRMEKSMSREAAFAFVFAIALAVAVAFFAMGTGGPFVALGLGLFMVTGVALLARGAFAKDRSEALAASDPRTFRRWWVILAAACGVVTIVFSVAQYIQDPSSANLGAIALLTPFGGLNLTGCWLRSRSRVSGDWLIVVGILPFMGLWWMIAPAVVGLVILVAAISDSLRAGTATEVAA